MLTYGNVDQCEQKKREEKLEEEARDARRDDLSLLSLSSSQLPGDMTLGVRLRSFELGHIHCNIHGSRNSRGKKATGARGAWKLRATPNH